MDYCRGLRRTRKNDDEIQRLGYRGSHRISHRAKTGQLPEMLVGEGVTGAGFEVVFEFCSLLFSLHPNRCYEFPGLESGCMR